MTKAEQQLTIREISRRTEIPESTLRYYRSLFPELIPTVGQGRQRRHPVHAVDVFRRIADLFALGHTRQLVRQKLAAPAAHSEADEREHIPTTSAHRGLEVMRRYEIERVDRLDGLGRGDLEGILSAMLMRDRELMAMQRELLNLVEHLVGVFGALTGRETDRPGRWERALPGPRDEPDVGSAPRTETSGEKVDPAELEQLRDSLDSERAMVERLRRARLELEQRLARLEREQKGGQSR